MIKVRLAIRDGGFVTNVTIPHFRKLPEVLVWSERIFGFHGELKDDGEPCSVEYREIFAFWIFPALESDFDSERKA
jgi:hypothetical protein